MTVYVTTCSVDSSKIVEKTISYSLVVLTVLTGDLARPSAPIGTGINRRRT